MRGDAAAGCVETKLLRLPAAQEPWKPRSAGQQRDPCIWQRPSSCAAVVLNRYTSHEQHRGHCVVHHDAMLPLSLLMAWSAAVTELVTSSKLGMTY